MPAPEGSQPVRDVQRLLRRLGDAPGPIDGLYGPLTSASVQRFQEAHALAVDGVVGPQTMGRLVAERGRLHKAKLERKSPARSNRAESVPEQPPARSPAKAQPHQAKPNSSTGPSPWLAAAVGGLALVLLLVVLTRLVRPRREPPVGPDEARSEARSRVRSPARGLRDRRSDGRGVRHPRDARSRRQAEHRHGRTGDPLIALGETHVHPAATGSALLRVGAALGRLRGAASVRLSSRAPPGRSARAPDLSARPSSACREARSSQRACTRRRKRVAAL